MRGDRFLAKVYRKPGGPFLVFVIKQGWAAIFGGLMLLAIIFTSLVDLPLLSRFDWLFVFAILIQLVLLLTRLERPREVITILVFHLVGLLMEVFKTSQQIGSWSYPGEAFFRLGNVPLFSGFMYAAVGSYIARSWRVLELDIKPYPKRIYTLLLSLAIYINFFTHHYILDFRWLLFIWVILLYRKTTVYYRLNRRLRKMPLLVGFFLIACFIWLAENIGTVTKTWLYPGQTDEWQPVSIHKLGAWFLLMIISFVLIDLLHVYYRRRRSQLRGEDLSI